MRYYQYPERLITKRNRILYVNNAQIMAATMSQVTDVEST